MREMRIEFVIPKEYLSGYPETSKTICKFNSTTEYSVNKGDVIMLDVPGKGLSSAVVLSTNDLIVNREANDTLIYRSIEIAVIDTSVEG